MKPNIYVRGIFGLSACQKDEDGNVIPGTVRDLGTFDDMSTAENPGGSPNLITDNGMEMLKSTDFLSRIMVSSDSTAPAKTDTALAGLVATSGTTTVSEGPNDFTPVDYPWCSANVSVQFAQGAAAGNLSKVAIGTSSTNMFAIALIKDGSGNPTTITVTSIEFLTVTYQWRMYYDLTWSQDNTFTVDSVSTTTTLMQGPLVSSDATDWNVNGSEGRNLYGKSYYSTTAPTSGNSLPSAIDTGQQSPTSTLGGSGVYSCSFTYNFTISNMNATGIAGLSFGRESGFPLRANMKIDPAISKDNTKTLTIKFTRAWARKVP